MGIFLNRGNEEFSRAVNSHIYVDKTDMIDFFNQVINTEQCYVCVSRPRRFGKSITANMIAAYFERGCDSRELFENRKLGQISNWDCNLNQYDTIRIDIADIISREGEAEKAFDYMLSGILEDLISEFPDCNICEDDKIAVALDKVNSNTGKRFVFIIDEWDCFFREYKDNIELQNKYMNLLRSLFKGNTSKRYLALAYMTGILPIKRYSNESALNNFYEYTMVSPLRLAKYVGFTEGEVQSICSEYRLNYDEAMAWYDGYSFSRVSHICSPNSIVKAALEGEYKNYWSQTAAFYSLAEYINLNFDGLRESIVRMIGGQREDVNVIGFENDMVSFKSKDDILTLLIHLGYLAYDSEEEKSYIPNKEVRQVFERVVETTPGWTELAKTIGASERLLEAT